MTIRRSRVAIRRDQDHRFVPTAGRTSPRQCRVCGMDGFSTYAVAQGEPRWFHGNLSQTVISHPDATVVFNSGWRRHYPHPLHDGATLCGRRWAERGRELRLSDGMRGEVCLDCLQEINKTSERSTSPGVIRTQVS